MEKKSNNVGKQCPFTAVVEKRVLSMNSCKEDYNGSMTIRSVYEKTCVINTFSGQSEASIQTPTLSIWLINVAECCRVGLYMAQLVSLRDTRIFFSEKKEKTNDVTTRFL